MRSRSLTIASVESINYAVGDFFISYYGSLTSFADRNGWILIGGGGLLLLTVIIVVIVVVSTGSGKKEDSCLGGFDCSKVDWWPDSCGYRDRQAFSFKDSDNLSSKG